MASIWRRSMVYLGLVDDDEYDDYETYPEPASPSRSQTGPPRAAAAPRGAPAASRRPGPAPERAYEPEQSSGVRTLPARDPRGAGGGGAGGVSIPRGAVVRPIQPTQTRKVHIVNPGNFNDAQEVGDRLKATQPVILNLQGVDRDLSRRLIDFASGVTYALGGGMERVAESVFLLAPTNVELSAEEKRRLQEQGLYRS